MTRAGTLSANVIDFCGWLRGEFHFLVGPGEVRDALRAVDILGVDDPNDVRRALRLTLCSKPDDAEIFDQAFDAFFLYPQRGRPQSLYAPRHTLPRPGAQTTTQPQPGKSSERARGALELGEASGQGHVRDAATHLNEPASARTVRAEYSSQAGSASPPAIAGSDVRAHLKAAATLIDSVRLGRLRRWKPQTSGRRFDVRRTLRASLHTGDDLVALRFLGHPLRNPRFVVLIDGSRSMSGHAPLMLEFAYALVRRSRRANVFLFSTTLREVTLQLRKAAHQHEHHLSDLGDAWGGGTRIGQSLGEFVHEKGARCLSDETVTIIYSDGLDVGEVRQLERAMHEIHRRSACVIWVNPLVGTPGYAPEAKGMRASLPFIDALVGVRDAQELTGLARVAAAATR